MQIWLEGSRPIEVSASVKAKIVPSTGPEIAISLGLNVVTSMNVGVSVLTVGARVDYDTPSVLKCGVLRGIAWHGNGNYAFRPPVELNIHPPPDG